MDPVSLTASVVAVVGFASRVCAAISHLRSLCKNLPGRVHAVSNEIADLELVLLQISSLMEARAGLPESKCSVLPHLLRQAKSKLSDIESIVSRLTQIYIKSKTPLALVGAWRANQERLKDLQDDLRAIKSNLNMILGATSSEDMLRIRLDIETISTASEASSHNQSAVNEKLITTLCGVDERIARVEELLLQQSQILHMNQFTQVRSAYGTGSHAHHRARSPRPNYFRDGSCYSDLSVRVNVYEATCRTPCSCSCHTEKQSSSPASLNNLFGRLFVGYTGIPLLKPRCDDESCRGSRSKTANIEYWFPASFWSRILRMELSYQKGLGPSLQLEILRKVPDNAECVNLAIKGNIQGLNSLFQRGLASPRDVSATRGYSLLRWALYSKQYEMCKFLVRAGADADYKPLSQNDNSPRIKACHFLLEGNISKSTTQALRAITDGSEHLDNFIDESSFSQIHLIVLGLNSGCLEKQLILSPEDIDEPDTMGRTPLAWAAAKGDSRSIVTLLTYGANPNIIDAQLSGALSNAAAQGHTACARLLLDAGADPDPPLPLGVKKGSPLNVAARRAEDSLLVKVLLDFGANVDSSGVDGKTGLCYAAQIDDASLAILLLEHGAEINVSTTAGDTPLTIAITHNSHNVLRLFLERWHEYSVCPRLKGPHLLSVAARYADIETITILSTTDHFRLKYDEKYAVGDFGSLIRNRAEASDKLIIAFDELLSTLQSTSQNPQTLDSLMEAGHISTISCIAAGVIAPNSPHVSEKSSADDMFYDAME